MESLLNYKLSEQWLLIQLKHTHPHQPLIRYNFCKNTSLHSTVNPFRPPEATSHVRWWQSNSTKEWMLISINEKFLFSIFTSTNDRFIWENIPEFYLVNYPKLTPNFLSSFQMKVYFKFNPKKHLSWYSVTYNNLSHMVIEWFAVELFTI